MSEQIKKTVRVDGEWVRKEDVGEIGQCYGLVIAISKYAAEDQRLQTAVPDAQSVVKNLRQSYGFDRFVELYDKDATARNIKKGVYKLQEVVKPQDNVLIYFSGLGAQFSSAAPLGYWIPVDAKPGEWHKCVEVMTLCGLLREELFPARHVLVVSDACFADPALKPSTDRIQKADPPAIHKALRTRSREYILSGTDAPVPHESGRHSIFTSYFLSCLRNPHREVFTSAELYARIKGRVGELNPSVNGRHQVPQYGAILRTGHAGGGAFVFLRRVEQEQKKQAEAEPAPAQEDVSASMKFQYRLRDLEQKAQKRQAAMKDKRRTESAKNAFQSARKIDGLPGVTEKEKIDVWMEYIREFPQATEQVQYAKQRVEQLVKELKAQQNGTKKPKKAPPPAEASRSQAEMKKSKDNVFVQQYFNAGCQHFDKGEFDKAIEYFKQLLILDPRHVDAYNMRGLAYAEKGQFDQAQRDFTQAVSIDPNNSEAYYNRANVHLSQKRYGEAIEDVSKAITINPQDADAHYLRGVAFDAMKDYGRAVKDFSKAIKLNPQDGSYYYNRGLAYLDRDEAERAINDFTQAIKLGQKEVPVYLNRAEAYQRSRKFQEAFNDYSAVLKMEPGNKPARVQRAHAALMNKDYQHAVQDFSRLIEDEPKDTDLYYKRGTAYYRSGDLDRALADFDRVRQAHPRNPEFWLHLGEIHANKGDYRQAVSCFSEAIKHDPELYDAYLHRGIAYCEMVEYQPALEDLDRALELNPKDPIIYNYRAHANFHKGAYGNAWRDIERCRELGGKPDEVIVNQLKKNTGRG